MIKVACCIALLALGLFALPAHAQQCPIKPEEQQLDFSSVAKACSDASTVCSACTCALVDVYRPALVAGGVTFDPKDPTTFPLDKTAAIIRACSEQYIVSMLMANINVTALSALSSCSYSADTVPSCLAPAVSAIAAGNTTVVATSRDADATVPAGTTELRVATVQKQGDTVLITLAGQLSSASQLLKAMMASTDLMAALPAASAEQLQALSASGASIDANPNTANTLAALANPIDAVALINSMAQLTAAAPPAAAVAPAAPEPAAAPKSAALAASPVMAAVASVLLVAALL